MTDPLDRTERIKDWFDRVFDNRMSPEVRLSVDGKEFVAKRVVVNTEESDDPEVDVVTLSTDEPHDPYAGFSFSIVGPKKTEQDIPSITCPRCDLTSHNQEDIRHRYCGACHAYHEPLGRPPNLRAGGLRQALDEIRRNTACGWARGRAGKAIREDDERKAVEQEQEGASGPG